MNIGDTVRFLDSVGGGVVKRIDEARQIAYVEDSEGFEVPTVFSQCVVVSSVSDPEQYTRRAVLTARRGPSEIQMQTKAKAEQPKPEQKANGKKEARQPEQMEVDLHMEALMPGSHAIPPAEILQYQLRTFRKVMQEQKRHRGKRIVFIHGKGEGILRRELAGILNREYPTCSYMDASFSKYSSGATMVLIN